MITIEKLNSFGADTTDGLERCFGNESLYLKLVTTIPEDSTFERLNQKIAEKNLDGAFEAAHALKGVLGNLSLTPLYEIAVEITELLRARTQTDYAPILQTILEKRDALKQMCEG